ncbi:MAG TPA: trehalose-phosphatase [Cyclobacteriaceae bacterium]
MENISNYEDSLFLHYLKSENRIFFFDYDGTLVPIQNHPGQAAPSALIRSLLINLASDLKNKVIIISGRGGERLEQWLGDLPVTLVAEHGGVYKEPNQEWQILNNETINWKERILPALHALEFQYEGTFVEEKKYSLVWHYRMAKHKVNDLEKKQILAALRTLHSANEFLIYDEDCALELRSTHINKGMFASHYIWHNHYDFLLAIGDGKTDEDLFETIGNDCYTIRVGKSNNSAAKFFINDQESVVLFLCKILALRNGVNSHARLHES